MANSIGPNGITVNTREELILFYTTQFKLIYGNDINLEQDTPDGQMMNIWVQEVLDMQDLLVQINNSFNPDNAIGVILDQRIGINGIQRQAGTYTTTNITIVTSQACNLYGLDQSTEPVFTVQDDAGTKWLLLATENISGATTTVALFRAENEGKTLTIPNTITTPVTIVLGVTSVNNPTTYSTLGVNEESDEKVKVRRQKSVSLASQGYYASLRALLLNTVGVADAFIYENVTDAVDSNDVPGHSIWVIVSGTATPEDIANAIYRKRNAGCGMKGDETYIITQVDNSPFLIRWDNVASEKLFIFFVATSLDGENVPDVPGIREGLVTSYVPDVAEEVDINGLATSVQDIDDNTLVTNSGFTNGRLTTFTLSLVPASGTFKINYNGNASAFINWNDNVATIEAAVQAVPGLSAVTVTGSLATQSLEIDLDLVPTIESLLTITDNTLEDSGATPITFDSDFNLALTLETTSKKYQFAVEEENIIITDILFLPASSTIVVSGTQQFETHGGYGDYIYAVIVNNSGASIDAFGLYTAGVTPGTDTVEVTDALGNKTTALVNVI